jgi:hypothetical protein
MLSQDNEKTGETPKNYQMLEIDPMISTKTLSFIVAMSLALGVSPLPALASKTVIYDNDQNIQINVATQTQNADELVDDDDQGEGGSNPSNNGATVTNSSFQTADVHQENNLVNSDFNTIDQNTLADDSNHHKDKTAHSNNGGHSHSNNGKHDQPSNIANIAITTIVNASGG